MADDDSSSSDDSINSNSDEDPELEDSSVTIGIESKQQERKKTRKNFPWKINKEYNPLVFVPLLKVITLHEEKFSTSKKEAWIAIKNDFFNQSEIKGLNDVTTLDVKSIRTQFEAFKKYRKDHFAKGNLSIESGDVSEMDKLLMILVDAMEKREAKKALKKSLKVVKSSPWHQVATHCVAHINLAEFLLQPQTIMSTRKKWVRN